MYTIQSKQSNSLQRATMSPDSLMNVSELEHEADNSVSQNQIHDALSRYTRAIDIRATYSRKKLNQILCKRAEAFIRVKLHDEALRDVQRVIQDYDPAMINAPNYALLDPEEARDCLLAYSQLYRIHKQCDREQEAHAALRDGIRFAQTYNQDIDRFTRLCSVDEQIDTSTELKTSSTSNKNLAQEDLDELECPLCYRVFYEPVTLPCGHTFDRSCLARVFDYTDKCPLCREVSHILPVHLPVTVVVNQLAQRYMPQDYEQRKKEEIEQKRLDVNNIPLFVLDYVLYPGTLLPLHIFEPRYRLMMRRCISGSKCFGLVPAGTEPGEMAKYGCLARITNIKLLPDGRSLIETVGQERFCILEKWEQDGYVCGKVKFINDEPPADQIELNILNDMRQKVWQLLSTFMGEVGNEVKEAIEAKIGKMPSPNNAEELSYWVAALLPLSTPLKLDLLAITKTKDRLHVLLNICNSLAQSQNSCAIQ